MKWDAKEDTQNMILIEDDVDQVDRNQAVETEQHQEQELPSYSDATVDAKAPLLPANEKEQQQQSVQAVEPPKYQRQEGVDETEAKDYSTGLFDCFKDPSSCALACFCPCATSGIVNATLDVNEPISPDVEQQGADMIVQKPSFGRKFWYSLPYTVLAFIGPNGCTSAAGVLQRWGIRAHYGMESHGLRDVASHAFCHVCAMAQDHREIKIRQERRQAEFQGAQLQLAGDL